jgi:dihydrofolate reductase
VRVSLIVAADEHDTIGRGGALAWHIPEDLRRFKAITTGHIVVSGRKTHDSIVARLGHPLPERSTIVVTRQAHPPDESDEGSVVYQPDVVSALAEARAQAQARGDEEVFVIGGAQIYTATLPYVCRVYLTRVHDTVAGDARMPEGWLEPFDLVHSEPRDGFTFQTYDRILHEGHR